MPRKKKTQEADVVPMKAPEVVEAEPEMSPDLQEGPIAAPGQPEQQQLSLNDLKMGYIVGLTPDGNFVFELLGQEKGLVELLGIHEHATKRVDRIYEDSQLSGDRLTHEVGKAIAIVNQKIDQLLQVIAPPKPDNKIE